MWVLRWKKPLYPRMRILAISSYQMSMDVATRIRAVLTSFLFPTTTLLSAPEKPARRLFSSSNREWNGESGFGLEEADSFPFLLSLDSWHLRRNKISIDENDENDDEDEGDDMAPLLPKDAEILLWPLPQRFCGWLLGDFICCCRLPTTLMLPLLLLKLLLLTLFNYTTTVLSYFMVYLFFEDNYFPPIIWHINTLYQVPYSM